jgi:pyruvate dehydrogenase E2 component (dihydrolipoamide acetyltransferase)
MSTPEEAEATLRRLVHRPRLVGRQMASAVLAQVDRPGARAGLGQIAATLGTIRPLLADAVAGAARLDIPKLVIWGASDLTNPIDETYLAGLGADTVIVEETAHLPHMENAVAVNRAMVRFLEETLRSG